MAVILITFTHTRNNLESGFTYFIVEEPGTAILSKASQDIKPDYLIRKLKA